MAVQGFFSPDRKTRMAGEKENKAFYSVKVEPVKVANNINQYNLKIKYILWIINQENCIKIMIKINWDI